MNTIEVKVVKVKGAEDLPLPKYETSGAAGMDLYANVKENVVLKHGDIKLIKTGIAFSLPQNVEAQVRPRSGLALKYGITVWNSPGTVDEDFIGEVGVILANFGENDFEVKRGDRIAQIVFNKVEKTEWKLVDSLDKTERGDGGFGHTGK
jgi:dUTP pyrophosphatase